MADTAITGFAAITGSSVNAAADVLPLIDVSESAATANKKIVVNELKTAMSLDAATQEQQETGTVTTAVVTPGRQQYHDSAAKFWGYVTVSGGAPTLQDSYNVTSIGDGGEGILDVTIDVDFSSANWADFCSIKVGTPFSPAHDRSLYCSSKAAGTVQFIHYSGASNAYGDPQAWSFGGFGDQA